MIPDEILSFPPRAMTQTERERYFDEGYVLIEAAIGGALLEELRDVVRELRERAQHPEQRSSDFEYEVLPSGKRVLRQILCAADYHEALWPYASQAPLTDFAADVVGPNVKFRETNLSFKEPGGRGFDWHQDMAFFPSTNLTPMMLFTFIEDVTEEMGPTRVIPGSHRGEFYDHYDEAGQWLGHVAEHDKPRLCTQDAVSVTGPAGSIFITNGGVVHSAGPNRSGRPRPVLITGYSNVDALTVVEIPYQSRYRWRLVSGEETGQVHSEPLRMKMPPDWSTYQGVRIDNLVQR